MDDPLPCAGRPENTFDPAPVVTRYLARQPILDAGGRVIAYELLFRNGAVSAFSGQRDVASKTMIDNTMMYGFAKLTAGLPAFLNCTENTLTSEYLQMLPSTLTVLEVLEDVKVTEAVVQACLKFKRKGYRIALDDFEYHPMFDPLIRIADFIKIDFRSTPGPKRRELIEKLTEFTGAYLAEKVETREEFETAKEEGFTLFQGFYFREPALLKKKVVPSNRHVHLRLLAELQRDPLDIAKVGELVKSEPSLTYRLFRYVHSAASGMAQQITSIRIALLVAGDDLFRRMATLAAAVELNAGSSPEILRMALVRARFCETTAALCNLNPTEQYLVGLFSLLDAMLQMPMREAIEPLSLAPAIRDALLGAGGRHRRPIQWLEMQERANFAMCDKFAASLGLTPQLLGEHFNAAMLWSDELLAAR